MKNAAQNILAQFRKLSLAEREAVLAQLAIQLDPADEKFLEKTRNRDGVICPFCGGHDCLKKNGRVNGRQRYLCKTTKRTFGTTTGSVLCNTQKPLSVWKQFIACMMDKLTLRESAKRCGIHRNTAFLWRHKILDSLRVMMSEVKLSGIVEADEAFLRVSYSGNHKNNKHFAMPRKAHKRGNQAGKRGLSKEQVCIPCAINRKGLSVSKTACLGMPTNKAIQSVFESHIENGSILCTDKSRAYDSLTASKGLEHIPVGKERTLKGEYGIQHINAYHTHFKNFMDRFYGVTTKHLDNYLVFYNFVQYAKGSTMDKVRILLEHIICVTCYSKREDVYARPVLPFAA